MTPNCQLGVSLAGAEFGCERIEFCNTRPGTYGKDYLYPTKETIQYFARQGVGLYRIPFCWERIQPQLNSDLDATELTRLLTCVREIAQAGGHTVLDVHNYGRYRLELDGTCRSVIIDEQIDGHVPVGRKHLADLWRRLAIAFEDETNVIGYGLMNEPHDLGSSDWKQISQAAVDAIREVDQKTHVLVAGDGWSNSHRWEQCNGPAAWIHDPVNRCVYESHCYFDATASGKYQLNYAEELRLDSTLPERPVQRIRGFIEWCRRNQVPGFIGEFGVPGDDPGWLNCLKDFLQTVQAAGFPVCYWAAGEWWDEYPLSIHPQRGDQPAPQLSVLQDAFAS